MADDKETKHCDIAYKRNAMMEKNYKEVRRLCSKIKYDVKKDLNKTLNYFLNDLHPQPS